MAWIELHQALPTHWKTKKLKRILKIKTPQAVGHIVMLWLWAIDNAPDGDLSHVDAEDIAEVCEWTKRGGAETFVSALKEAGWIDDDMHLHDWEEYAGKLQAQREDKRREKERERKARQRANQRKDAESADRAETNGDELSHGTKRDCPTDVPRDINGTVPHVSRGTETGQDGTVPPLHYTTEHYTTQQNRTEDEDVPPCPTACTPGQPAAPPLPSPSSSSSSQPSACSYFLDRLNPMASQRSLESLLTYESALGTDVCIFAMDIALDNRTPTWPFVRTILQSWKDQNVKCLADAQAANDRHRQGKKGYASAPEKPDYSFVMGVDSF